MQKRHVTLACTIAAAIATAPTVAAAGEGAPGPYDRDTVIVKYRDGVSAAERRLLLERTGVGRTVSRIGVVDADVAHVTGDPADAASRLEDSPKVAYAEPDFVVEAAGATPNDPRFDRQWGLHNRGQGGGKRDADIDAPEGWAGAGLAGFPLFGGVPVGIVDTGVDPAHPDLLGRVQACDNFLPGEPAGTCADDFGHGTHVAGIAGATADNGIGIAGVAFNSPLIVCRALAGPDGDGNSSGVAKCIGWTADQGARVINMSFSGRNSETVRRAVQRAWSGGDRNGAVMVAAAGNGGFYSAQYPATLKQVISVGATNRHDDVAGFSNRHKDVELAAPGAGIISTEIGGGYAYKRGTSMAVPHVAGVAAQLRRLHPHAGAARIRRILTKSVRDLGPPGRDRRFGYGRVSLAKAVKR